MHAVGKILIRLVMAIALSAAMLLPHTSLSHAATPRLLVAKDFYSLACCAQYVSTMDPAHPVPTIAGVQFSNGMLLGHSNFGNASATFNMARYPGYGTFTAIVGIVDGSTTNIAERLNITGDGKQIYSHVFAQGELAVSISVPLGKAKAITLEADSAGDSNATGLLLANPSLLPSGSGGPGMAPAHAGLPHVHFLSATVAGGGQQAAQVTTTPGASVVVVVDYPNGAQTVFGPKPAGAGGQLALIWTLPSGVHGLVHVTVDSNGKVAQGTFALS